MASPPLLGFVGASNSGKTTLVAAVVAELCRRGLALGVLKHHGHPEPLPLPAAEQGKDTTRHLMAGARRAALVHAGGVRLLTSDGGNLTPAELTQLYMADLDLVLVEGFKSAALDKIEVVAPGKEPLLPAGGRLLALARRGGTGVEAGLPVLDAGQPAAVAGFVLEHLGLAGAAPQAGAAPRVSLRVDGQELDLNPFVARLLEQTLRGLVAPPLPSLDEIAGL
ncbi:MAG: molybdopterin-guanine dinucleotide biosynthesis protein B [Desulfarculus sp.]|nr:molybdopterin-guanine dinucleotide biosynthesis protein B [Desulfarculus sp.]